MGIKTFKPTTPSLRFTAAPTFEEVTSDKPLKSLTCGLRKTGGRNNKGRITMRFRGGGHKQLYRLVDFHRDKQDIPAKVATIEYDPNRSARIALLHYKDGEKRYIIAPDGLKVGGEVVSGPQSDILTGNSLPLKNIPIGSLVHNLELKKGKGAQLVRSAGAVAQLLAKEGEYAQVKLPSGEVRKIHMDCYASIGQVGNTDHNSVSIGKAGRTIWTGRRPHVRGVAMNPIDHPHGGGEGKTSGGRHPVTPWGVPTKGFKTRNSKRTDSMIIKRRK